MEPYVIIHCKSQFEFDNLMALLEIEGYHWNGDGSKPRSIQFNVGNYIHLYNNEYGKLIRYSTDCPRGDYVEYSMITNKIESVIQ